jgi:IS5 family transposase
MYSHRKKTLQTELALFEFKHPFGAALDHENRWVRLAALVPWDEVEGEYGSHFGVSGHDAYPVRMALGSLIIRERLKLTDEERVEQIRENPYLQYFIGMQEYGTKQPFDPSLMVHFRSRIRAQMLLRVNEAICSPKNQGGGKDTDKSEPPSNTGKLIIDATCAPEDMRHPTDSGLLRNTRSGLSIGSGLQGIRMAGNLGRTGGKRVGSFSRRSGSGSHRHGNFAGVSDSSWDF